MNRAKFVGLLVLTGFLACVYLMAGSAKLMGAPEMVDSFQVWGYPDWFRLLVGCAEVIAAILLLIPRTTAAGAALLCLIMVGAVDTHLRWQEYIEAFVPLTLGTLCAVLAVAREPGFLNFHFGQKVCPNERRHKLQGLRQLVIKF